jgi:hypothetical protein
MKPERILLKMLAEELIAGSEPDIGAFAMRHLNFAERSVAEYFEGAVAGGLGTVEKH